MSRRLTKAKVVDRPIKSTQQSTLVSAKSNQKSIINSSFQLFQQKFAGFKQTSSLRNNVRTGSSSFDNEGEKNFYKKSSQCVSKAQEAVSDERDKDTTHHLKTSTYLNIDESFVNGFNEPTIQMSKSLKDLKSMSGGEQVCRKQLMQSHLSMIEVMELLDLYSDPETLKQAMDRMFQQLIVQPPSEIAAWISVTAAPLPPATTTPAPFVSNVVVNRTLYDNYVNCSRANTNMSTCGVKLELTNKALPISVIFAILLNLAFVCLVCFLCLFTLVCVKQRKRRRRRKHRTARKHKKRAARLAAAKASTKDGSVAIEMGGLPGADGVNVHTGPGGLFGGSFAQMPGGAAGAGGLAALPDEEDSSEEREKNKQKVVKKKGLKGFVSILVDDDDSERKGKKTGAGAGSGAGGLNADGTTKTGIGGASGAVGPDGKPIGGKDGDGKPTGGKDGDDKPTGAKDGDGKGGKKDVKGKLAGFLANKIRNLTSNLNEDDEFAEPDAAGTEANNTNADEEDASKYTQAKDRFEGNAAAADPNAPNAGNAAGTDGGQPGAADAAGGSAPGQAPGQGGAVSQPGINPVNQSQYVG